ncbi:uncharacterized protein BJ212DRAFT_1345661, partial [Suillus subaureus]
KTPWQSLCGVVDYSGIFDAECRHPLSRCMESTRVVILGSLRQVPNMIGQMLDSTVLLVLEKRQWRSPLLRR